jgi:two-component sensor histidine kinase
MEKLLIIQREPDGTSSIRSAVKDNGKLIWQSAKVPHDRSTAGLRVLEHAADYIDSNVELKRKQATAFREKLERDKVDAELRRNNTSDDSSSS